MILRGWYDSYGIRRSFVCVRFEKGWMKNDGWSDSSFFVWVDRVIFALKNNRKWNDMRWLTILGKVCWYTSAVIATHSYNPMLYGTWKWTDLLTTVKWLDTIIFHSYHSQFSNISENTVHIRITLYKGISNSIYPLSISIHH